MPDLIADNNPAVAALAAEQRPRLVNLCALLTGSRQAAEDLAQETLVEAWQHRDRLVDPRGGAKWLSVIARHVCLRWLRAQGRRAAHLTDANSTLEPELDLDGLTDSAPNLEIELERDELAELLDHALAQLPPPTRDALIHKYVLDMPQAQIAARLGLSEGAVEARLERGKLSLRRLLQTDLRPEANTFGLCIAPSDQWQATRLWCPICGQHRLYGQLPQAGQDFQLHCPRCSWQPRAYFAQTNYMPEFDGVSGFRALLTRFMAYMHHYLAPNLRAGQVACRQCGQPVRLRRELPAAEVPYPGYSRRGVSLKCPACGARSHNDIYGLALDTPAGIKFWRENPKMSTVPEIPVTVGEQPAWLIRFQSRTTAAQLEVLLAQDSYALLDGHAEHAGR